MGNCVKCECAEYQNQQALYPPPMTITQPTEDGAASPPLSPLPIRLLHQSSTRSYLPLSLRFRKGRKMKRRKFEDAIGDRAHNLKSIYAYSDWDWVEKSTKRKGVKR